MKKTLLRFCQVMIVGLTVQTPFMAHAAQAPAFSEAEAIRFLRQSTFGPTTEMVAEVRKIGFDKFLTRQFKMKGDNYPKLKFYPESQPEKCNEKCVRDNYTYYQLQRGFFESALEGSDQLRQRVAFALSQILVTSQGNVPMPAWMRVYQEVLYDHAFGNYRQLLYDVTLNPAMGRYLDMLNNRCQRNTDPNLTPTQRRDICGDGFNSQPNENYAREILQLFSLGTFMLNQDGTYQVDAQGMPIPTYDQTTVEEFARVFTGWTLAKELKFDQDTVPNYKSPMVVFLDSQGREARHDRGPKTLLNNFPVPAQTPASLELDMAIDNIIGHSNVAPFISKQLIRHLVTSNPTPAYVGRVAQAFAANIDSPKQLEHVVRAILMDTEARTAPDSATDPDFGKLSEPALFMLNFLRAFDAKSDGVLNGGSRGSSGMGQDVFRSPTVFNYYPAEYEVPGEENLVGPVFGIFSSQTLVRRANFIYQIVYNGSSFQPDPPERPKGTIIKFTTWDKLAADPVQLIDRLSCWLLHCTMGQAMKDTVLAAVNAVPATDLHGRAQMAIFLVATSAQYQVQR